MSKKISTFIIICMIFISNSKFYCVNAQEPTEMRAAWITTVYNQDWPGSSSKNNEQLQKKEFIKILDDVKSLGFNTVVVQVRPKGDALYKSNLNPWSDVLTGTQGKNPAYDPLAFMVEEAHKRGLEIHAWLNPYRVTTSGTDLNKLSSDSFARKNPDTVMPYEWTDNGTTKSALVYNPGLPKVRNYIVHTVKEIVSNYDVDAIHFDDYFYPNGSYNDDETYKMYGNGMNREDWRRENINTLVREVYNAIKSIDNSVEFGISPRGIWKNNSSDSTGSDTNGSESYYDIYCDTRKWIKNGWIDYVTPQIYWNIGYKIADYSKLINWWSNEVKNTKTKLYIGQGIYKDSVAKEIDQQITLNRKIDNIKGSMFFSYRDIRDNRQGLRDKISSLYSMPVDTPTNKPNSGNDIITKDGIIYKTHIQDIGWQDWKSNEEISGTEGQSKRLEGIQIKLNNILPGASIKYRTHIQDIGWQDWKSDGELSGTEGQSKRLEAVQIILDNAPEYKVEYRTHIQDIGWQDWKSNGEISGTTGQSKRLEAIQIRIVKEIIPKIEYKTHIQDIGWQGWKSNGQTSGTEGQSKRLEAIQINLVDAPINAKIIYQTHVQDIGWQDWKNTAQLSGTEGQSKRLEAIKIKLENLPGYKIEYRTHVQDYGWQDWKSDGEISGTEGQSKRLEAIEIRLIKE